MSVHSLRLFALLGGLSLAALLPACGGDSGADGTPVASAAELPELRPLAPEPLGVFGGAIARGYDADLLLVVREDGTKLGIYGTNASTSFRIGGYLYIGGEWRSGFDPTVYNGRDWGRNGLAVYFDASYEIAKPSLSGTIRSATETLLFSGGPIPGSDYDFNMPAKVAGV